MRGFFGGVVSTLLVVFGGALLVINRGWFPIGADNPPGSLERRLSHMATDAYDDQTWTVVAFVKRSDKLPADAQAAWKQAAAR